MKKLLLLLLVLSIQTLSSQNTASQNYLEKAKPYLQEDICNSQGINWVKAAIASDPNNEEAQTLLNNCNNKKYTEAIETLKSDTNNSKAMDTLERLMVIEEYNTEEANYL